MNWTWLIWMLTTLVMVCHSGLVRKSTSIVGSVRVSSTIGPVILETNSSQKPKVSKKQAKLRKLWRKKLKKLAKINREMAQLRSRVSESDRDLLLRKQIGDLLEAAKEIADPLGLNATFGQSPTKRGWRQSLIGELKKLNRRLLQTAVNGTTTVELTTSTPTSPNQTESSTEAERRKQKQKQLGVKVARVLKNLKSGAARTGAHQGLPKKFPMGPSAKPVGVAGAKCSNHQDCRPGLCCHQNRLNTSESTCYNHSQAVGTGCANSCQCQNDLMCYRAKSKAKLNHKRVHSAHSQWDKVNNEDGSVKVEKHSEGRGMCKVASITDIHHGVYLNDRSGIFETFPTPD